MSFRAGRVYADVTSQERIMDQVISRDGTPIAFDQAGQGPPVILVAGAFNDRTTGAALAAWLAPRFTVYRYDRRGRGDSGDTPPYAVDREIDDLAALIDRASGYAGGAACVLGFSSGAALALAAAARGLAISRLALYDLPLLADGPLGRARRAAAGSPDHLAALSALVAAGRRGDAVEYFQARVVGLPEAVVAQLRGAPFRPGLEAMAHTLVYDMTVLGDGALPADLSAIAAPTLAIAGEASFGFLRETAEALARALPRGESLTLPGATHELAPDALGPVLARHFAPAG